MPLPPPLSGSVLASMCLNLLSPPPFWLGFPSPGHSKSCGQVPKAVPSIFFLSPIPLLSGLIHFHSFNSRGGPHGILFAIDLSAKLMIPYLQYYRNGFHSVTWFLPTSCLPTKFTYALFSKPRSLRSTTILSDTIIQNSEMALRILYSNFPLGFCVCLFFL